MGSIRTGIYKITIKNRKILANEKEECDMPVGWRLGYIENRKRYMKCQ